MIKPLTLKESKYGLKHSDAIRTFVYLKPAENIW